MQLTRGLLFDLSRTCMPVCAVLQVVHDSNGGTTVSDLTLIDVNTPQVRLHAASHVGPQSHRSGAVRGQECAL